MSTSNRRKLRNRQRQQRQHKALRMESLENRLLLAADFQNPIIPTDVNADMQTDTRDVLDLVSSLHRDGSRALTINRFRSGGGEGEGPTKFLDVNGDNYLTPRDVLDVVRYLAEGEGPQVNARVEFTDTTGNVVTSANVNDVIELNLFIQDIRNPNDPDFPDLDGDEANLGIFSAYFDLRFPNTNATIVAASNVDTDVHPLFGFGPDYGTLNTGGGSNPFPTITGDLIQDLGGVQTDLFGGPVGPDEFLLFTVAFRIDSAPELLAVDDSFQVDEGVVSSPLDVLANDNLGGDLVFRREFADGLGKEVLTLLADQNDENSQVVPPEEILPVNGEARLSVSDAVFQGITINSATGGTATVDNNGTPTNFDDDFIRFTPSGSGVGRVVYTISDSLDNSATATATIEVGAINDPPVNIMPGNQTMNEDGSLVFNNANGNAIQTSDEDAGLAPVQMTLSVTNGVLNAAGGAGVVVSGQGTTTVTLDGTIDAINGALSGGGVTFTPTPNFAGSAVLTVTTNDLGNTGDGGPQSDTDSLTITVNAVNDAPVNLMPADQITEEGVAITFNTANGNRISTSDVDAANGVIRAELSLTTLDGPDAGDLTLGSTGGITIVGGANNSSNIAFTGTLTNINNALNNLVFTPATAFFGAVTLELSVNDQGNTGSGGALSDTDSILIEVESTVRPRARTDRPSVPEDSADNPIDVLANDAPNEGADVTLLSFTQPANGTVVRDDNGTEGDLADDRLVYTPNPNFEGVDVFSYTINDTSQQGANSTADVSVRVVGINDAPIANDDTVTAAEDTPLTIQGATLTGNDSPGPGEETTQTLTVTAVSGTSTAGGTVSVSGGVVTYSPRLNFVGADTFTYTVTDNGTTNDLPDPLTATATVTVTVTEVNDAPVAGDDTATVAEDNPLNLTAAALLANDTPGGGADEAGQTLTIISVSSPTAGGGTVTLSNGTITYTPAANFNGPDTFTYTVRDNGTTNGDPDPKTDTAVVTITVTEVNDPPVAGDDTADGVQTLPTTIPVGDLLANDSPGPQNESGQTLTVTAVSGTSANGGTVTLSNGVVTYTPADGFSGLDTFTYTVRDNGTTNGAPDPLTDTATVTIDVAEFIPSTIGGFVYVDGDNDGMMDSVERGVGGATVTLSGADFNGVPVNMTVFTDSSGFYEFRNLRPGDYDIRQSQPYFLIDGKDSLSGTPFQNDGFNRVIDAQGGVNSINNNFGERGLNPSYFTIHELRSAAVNEGFWLAQNTEDNSRFWFIMYEGWDNAESGEAILSADLKQVTLRVTDKAGTMHQTTVQINAADPRVRLLGNDAAGGRLLRIEGTAEDFGFDLQASTEVPAEAPTAEDIQLDPLQLHELQEVLQEEMLAAAMANQVPGDSYEAAVDAAFAEDLA